RQLVFQRAQVSPGRSRDGLTAQGMTLFLVEQNARHALNLSDRAYVMVNGQIRLSGSGQTLLNDPEVRKAYLGISG
ncbi:hypothetical protein ACLBP1_27990, partial [Klebsiella pneumoniae]